MNVIEFSRSTGLVSTFLLFSVVSTSCVSGDYISNKNTQLIKITDCSQSKTQVVMDDCRSNSYEKAKLKLSVIVEKVSKNYRVNEPKLETMFNVAQLKWNDYIGVECEFNSYYSIGGAGYNGYFLGCLELKVLKRIEYLESIIESP